MSPEEPLFYAVSDVARMTGVNHMTVRRAIGLGELPAYRIGRRLLIDRSDFSAWLKRLRTTKQEVAA